MATEVQNLFTSLVTAVIIVIEYSDTFIKWSICLHAGVVIFPGYLSCTAIPYSLVSIGFCHPEVT